MIRSRLLAGGALIASAAATRDMFKGDAPRMISRGEFRREMFKTDPAPQLSRMQKLALADRAATDAILAQAQPMLQQMINQSLSTSNNSTHGQTFNINLINVGLNRRIIIEVTGSIAPAAAEVLQTTPWGIMNLISNVTLTDLSNYQRINTNVRHLYAIASIRNRGAYGAAFTNDAPVGMGANVRSQFGPPVVAGGASTFRFFIEIPLAYHERDLRGAIWANVTGGQWRVSLTFNAAPVVASTATDLSNACYQSNTADVGVISNVAVIIHQDYLDQLPTNQNGQYILPAMSLAYNYLLLSAPQSGIVANTDFAVQYTNFRTFLSTMFEFQNGAGTLNPATDINYIGVQTANQVFLTKVDGYMVSLMTRQAIGDDFPAGFYYLDHRQKPIITQNYGNTQLVVNASSAAAGSFLTNYWEMLSVQNQALNAGSLAAS